MDIKTQMRLAHVRRWHIVQVDREQSVAEHTCRVQLLAQEICERAGLDPVSTYKTIRWALWHDMPEVVLGDLPTPTKRGGVFDAAERATSDSYCSILDLTPPQSLWIVKAADLLEAALYLEEHGRGPHAFDVYTGICDSLSDLADGHRFEATIRDIRDGVLNGWG